jgi:CRP/FNR family transcriptional regulator, cyclic AMP receptor protein
VCRTFPFLLELLTIIFAFLNINPLTPHHVATTLLLGLQNTSPYQGEAEVKSMSAIQLLRNEKDVIPYAAGQTIFKDGDPGDAMYVVLEGTVEIVHNGKWIEDVSDGSIFGEMALIDDQPRSASAIAKTDAQLARVNQQRFEFLVQYSPFFAIEVMRIMAKRLRQRINA